MDMMNHYIVKEDIESIANTDLPWENLKDCSVLITGANGYLATYIVYTLLYRNDYYKDNIKVYALCRNRDKAFAKFSDYLGREDFELVIQDVCESIDDKYRADYIIHAASPANPYVMHTQPIDVIRANVFGYDNLLRKVVEWGAAKMILLSSVAVYGTSEGRSVLGDETYRGMIDFTDIKFNYGMCKQMCEMISAAYFQQYGVNICTVRPVIVYGPGMVFSQKKHVTDFIKNYLCDEDIILKSTGDVVRSFVYIKDAIKGCFAVLMKGEQNEVYNISTETNICSVKELANIFTGFEKKLKIEYQISEDEYLKSRFLELKISNEKLRSLGWKEETSLKDGLWRTILWAQDVDFINL